LTRLAEALAEAVINDAGSVFATDLDEGEEGGEGGQCLSFALREEKRPTWPIFSNSNAA
jgi:hypothetical protein